MKLAIIGLLLLAQSLFVQATPLIDQPIVFVLSKAVEHATSLDQAMSTTDLELPKLLIEIDDLPEKPCWIPSTTRIVERNLTLPYHQQTLYGSNPCRSSK